MLLRYAKSILAGIAVSAISGSLFVSLIFIVLTQYTYVELDYVKVLVNVPEVQCLSLYVTGRSLAPIEEVIASSSLSPTAAVKLASTTSGDAPVNPWAAANQVVQPAQQQAVVQQGPQQGPEQGPQGGGPNNPSGFRGGSILRNIIFNLMLQLLRTVDSYADAATMVAGGTAATLSALAKPSTISASDTVSLQQALKACLDNDKQLKADSLITLSEKAQLQVDLALALAQNEQLQSIILTQTNVLATVLLITLIFGPLIYYGGWVMYYNSITKLKESLNRDASLS